MDTTNTDTTESTSRRLGYWARAVDRLVSDAVTTAFDAEGASRRDWRMLSVIDGAAAAPRPMREHKLRRLVERGWVARDGDSWTLTDAGREAKERLDAIADGVRSRVADAVPAEDIDATVATLEKIARALGWDEETPLPRRRHGHRHGFGHGRGRGHCGHGHGFRHAHEHDGRGHGDHGHREQGHGHHPGHRGQLAYERGFDAGFSRGRDAAQ